MLEIKFLNIWQIREMRVGSLGTEAIVGPGEFNALTKEGDAGGRLKAVVFGLIADAIKNS